MLAALWLSLLAVAAAEHVTLLLVADGARDCRLGRRRVAVEVPAGQCVATPLLAGGPWEIVLDGPAACGRQGGALLQSCGNRTARVPVPLRLKLDNRCATLRFRKQRITLQARCHPHPRRILAVHTPPDLPVTVTVVTGADRDPSRQPLPATSQLWVAAAGLLLPLLVALLGRLLFLFRHRIVTLRNRLVRDCLDIVPLSSVATTTGRHAEHDPGGA